MISDHSHNTPRGRRRRRSTEEMTTLIDWAVGDVIVDPAVEEELTNAAHLMRLGEHRALRRHVA